MNIPNFLDCAVVGKEGKLTDEWRQIFSQLFAELQGNLSQEGIKISRQSDANITTLNTSQSISATLYNDTTHRLMGNLNGTFKNIVQDGEAASLTTAQLTSLTPNKALVSDATKHIVSSTTSDTEITYLSGVTSSIQSQINNKEPIIVFGTSLQYWDGTKTWRTLDTSVVPENTNLYYTDARARAAISSTATGLTYTNTTGVISLTASYVIPTTTEESNWNSAYSDTSNATHLRTANTIVKRSASGNAALGLNDNNATPRLSLDPNLRTLIHTTGNTTVFWQDMRLYDHYADLSIDWYLRNLVDASGNVLVDWSHGILLDPDGIFSIDWISRELIDEVGKKTLDWHEKYVKIYNDAGTETIVFERSQGVSYQNGICFGNEEVLSKYDLDTLNMGFSGIWLFGVFLSIKAEIIGNTVTLKIPGHTDTATTASFITTGALPADLRPTSTLYLFAPQTVNNGANSTTPSLIVINTTGVMNIYNGTGNFSGVGSSGFRTFSVTYSCA